MKGIVNNAIEYFLNHIVAHIPLWTVRKIFYKLSGIKIGKNSYILMGCYIMGRQNISIGNGSYINERCLLDGRGCITIGNNVSISIGTQLLTGTHSSNSESFEYKDETIIIEDNVWTGINSIIMPGVHLYKGSILAAGSVAIKQYILKENFVIYSGVPANKIGKRNICNLYELGDWKPRLR